MGSGSMLKGVRRMRLQVVIGGRQASIRMMEDMLWVMFDV